MQLTDPSLKLLLEGRLTDKERSAVKTLLRRRDFLAASEAAGDRPAESSYRRAEIAALNWVLGLVRRLQIEERRDEMDEQDFREVERERDDRLADEAGEALRPDSEEEDDEPAIGEHLAEARAVEDHQERKHSTREEDDGNA